MQYFGIDIDGCITEGKGKFTDISAICELQKYIEKNNLYVFLSTGRSSSYVESIAQLLHINKWCICENGAYLYQPMNDEILLHPLITDKTLKALNDFKQLLEKNEYKRICKIETGKSICISLNPIMETIEDLYLKLSNIIDNDLLYINHSTTAVDITPKGVDKGSALEFLANISKFKLDSVVSIGDTYGDLPFMLLSGKKACPNNAKNIVQNICDYISPKNTTYGVLDILKYYNQSTKVSK